MVAESCLEKEAAEIQPKTEAEAVLQVKALEEMLKPEPVRSLNDSPFTIKLVVEATTEER